MPASLVEISSVIGGQITGPSNKIIKHLAIDSRLLFSPADALFVALRGDRHDGHKYIADLIEKKAVGCFLVEFIDESWLLNKSASFIKVSNTLLALQNLTSWHRSRFSFPVIGITGSNGKTIVKEWLYQLLSPEKHIIRSPKSYNSQVGVPLSIWNLEPSADMAIIEAGISIPGEMEKLEKIIKPDIGIITNIGEAHQENFANLEQKAIEKLKLFDHSKVVIYCSDHKIIHDVLTTNKQNDQRLFSWSFQQKADVIFTIIKEENGTIKLKYNYKEIASTLILPFTDAASIENIAHCVACLLYMDTSVIYINERIEKLAPIAMRLELKKGINDCTLINDSYNSDIHSLSIALDFLNQQKQHNRKALILSDIYQSGKPSAQLYLEVSQMLSEKKIDKLIGIGSDISKHASLFNLEKSFYKTTDDFIGHFSNNDFFNEAILLKGSRDFGFERISNLLEQKRHRTVLEINLSALVHNLNYYRSKLRNDTKIMVMVKAFSYGSGSTEIATILEYQKVDYLAVAIVDEGIILRNAGISLPIVVMNPEENSFRQMIEFNLEPEIYSFQQLNSFGDALRTMQIEEYPLHIKFNTGMNRLGFNEADIPMLVSKLKNNQQLFVASVFSHLAASDETIHDEFTLSQVKQLESMSQPIIDLYKDRKVLRHILNSSGIERFPEAQFEMVRLGIGLYGINPTNQQALENVSSLKTTISQIHRVPASETVGYGRKGKLNTEREIATIPIGYADGFNRKLGNNKGYVFVKNQKAKVVGNVCMDMAMIDVTGLDAREGDMVEVFGNNITITDIANLLETIPYEILTGISPRVKRIYYTE